MAALLARDVEAYSDAGGRFFAAKKPVRGRDKVALFFSNIAREGGRAPVRFAQREWNGLPGVMIERDGVPDRFAARFSFALELDAEGLIRRTYAVLNPAKLEGGRDPSV
jgi:RNA polymerase sigma-70 factor (ECF subfamily)